MAILYIPVSDSFNENEHFLTIMEGFNNISITNTILVTSLKANRSDTNNNWLIMTTTDPIISLSQL